MGVETPRVTANVLTSGENFANNRRVPMRVFTTQETIFQIVDYQWNDLSKEGGTHEVQWRWYHDDKLVGRFHRSMRFEFTPYTIYTSRWTSTLGVGHGKVETVVDGLVDATDEFDVVAPPAPDR